MKLITVMENAVGEVCINPVYITMINKRLDDTSKVVIHLTDGKTVKTDQTLEQILTLISAV